MDFYTFESARSSPGSKRMRLLKEDHVFLMTFKKSYGIFTIKTEQARQGKNGMFSSWNGSDTVIAERIVRNGFVFYPNTGLAEFSGIRKSFYNTAAQTILGMLLANYPSSTPADLIQEELPHRPVGKLMADFKASIRAVWPQIRVERTQKGYRMLLMQ